MCGSNMSILIPLIPQLFWEKRSENLDVFQTDEEVSEKNHLPLTMKPVGPNVKPDTSLQVIVIRHVQN